MDRSSKIVTWKSEGWYKLLYCSYNICNTQDFKGTCLLGKWFHGFPPPQKKIKIIYDFKKSIEFNLKKSHSPAFYSIDIGVAESKLSAITKEIYGLSPKKIINEGIILKAKKLLAENELIIKEISEELGFADAPHFVKFFKKETGMTPGQFKETL